jgi:hypothetical protein
MDIPHTAAVADAQGALLNVQMHVDVGVKEVVGINVAPVVVGHAR